MVGLTNQETIMGGKREPPSHVYEILTETAIRMYGLNIASRIDIDCADPMRLDQVAQELEDLANRLRRIRALVTNQPVQISALAAAGEVRLANHKIKVITKSGRAK